MQPDTLKTFMEVAALVNSSLDAGEIRRRAIEAATRLMDAEAGSLLLVDDQRRELYFEVALGAKGEILKEVRLKWGEGIAGWVAAKGEPVIVHDVQTDDRFFSSADAQTQFVTRSMIAAPLVSKGAVLGVLQAVNKLEGRFAEEDLEIFVALADLVAAAIENARLYERLWETFFGTTLALAEALELRDSYTGGHTRRVKQYSLAIGRGLGLADDELEQLKFSAILHDIGKIGVRDDVLLKNAPLTREEFAMMSRHAALGADILKYAGSLNDVVPGVRSHHERFDGAGYPDALAGLDIPRNGRIIAVADTFDAMTTDRPYRKALSRDTAIAELEKESGRQFDPEMVAAFVKVWRAGEV